MKSNPPLLNLVTNEGQERLSDDKLELRLGPPAKEEDQKDLLLSAPFDKFSSVSSTTQNRKFGHENHVISFAEGQGGKLFNSQVYPGSLPVLASSSEKAVNNGLKFQHPSSSSSLIMQYGGDNGGQTPPCGDNRTTSSCSQKRVAPPSAIGWPPIRSFRKKITASSSSLKPSPDPESAISKGEEKGKSEMVKDSSKNKDLFVKINMDGVPIGRKVNLGAYDSYESLSSAVDQLFRGLLAAQRDRLAATRGEIKLEDVKKITGLLDGNGEYTLVYEDNEGDRVLVGDVPWDMFISTVKRLRVLKSSELGVN